MISVYYIDLINFTYLLDFVYIQLLEIYIEYILITDLLFLCLVGWF